MNTESKDGSVSRDELKDELIELIDNFGSESMSEGLGRFCSPDVEIAWKAIMSFLDKHF